MTLQPTIHRRRGGAAAATLLTLALVAAACTGDSEEAGAPDGREDLAEDVTVLGEPDAGYEATIRRTEDGVPHITADTLADVAFGQGWASGEDRTCDLADQLVKIRGERARWLGPGDDDEHLDSDVAWRALGVYDRATADWDDTPAEVRELLGAFADGWNAHLRETGADGIAGWCAGEEWLQPIEAVDVYAYARTVPLFASSVQLVDMIPGAQPPDSDEDGGDEDGDEDGGDEDGDGDDDGGGDATGAPAALAPPTSASNGWAIGRERSATDGGMLVANPHFPWEGELRFWQVHLTVPGEVDIYGAQLSGLPGIGIGFTETFGWTHTVSAGNRFTAYRLELVDGDPTSYRYGDDEREMTATTHEIEVRQPDGNVDSVSRTTWSSHYGPVIDFPGVGWTDEAAFTYRDANIDNTAFAEQYLAMMRAADLDELIDFHATLQGVPLFNTIAVSDDGRAWYADTSATPALSDEAIEMWEQQIEEDVFVATAADMGAVLLDGSDPRFEWQDLPGARDPGLVPFDHQPVMERTDYVFNANDSYWTSHATELLEGDFSPLHGRAGTARSPRTRENARLLSETGAGTPSGEDGRFTLDTLSDAALQNTAHTAHELRAAVVARCEATPTVTIPAAEVPRPPAPDPDDDPPVDDTATVDDAPLTVDLTDACAVLAQWDGAYDLDRTGPPLWRELLATLPGEAFTGAGELFAEPFDPADPLRTPSGLGPAGPAGADDDPEDDGDDPVLVRLARAVQALELAGFEPDVTLGELQFAPRAGERVPIHGGTTREGVPNQVGWGHSWSILDPALAELDLETPVEGAALRELDGETGYPINNGTSFLLALAYGDDGPEARVLHTFGNAEDRDDPRYVAATEEFSEKDWRPVAFDADDVRDRAVRTVVVQG